jgi:hypothetical protein
VTGMGFEFSTQWQVVVTSTFQCSTVEVNPSNFAVLMSVLSTTKVGGAGYGARSNTPVTSCAAGYAVIGTLRWVE